MKKKLKIIVSLVLVLLIFTSLFTGLNFTASAAETDAEEAGFANPNVLSAQHWLNATYGGRAGYVPIDEDGVSYSTTFITLVMAFQIELGFPSYQITGTFGPLTKKHSPTLELNKTNNNNIVKILQHALLCKGYYDTKVTGIFDVNTQNQIIQLQTDAGLTSTQISKKATPLVLQAALSTEIYVLAEGGDARIQEIQRALNRDYLAYIGLQPCDGIFGPNTVDSLITALQAIEGLPSEDTATGDIYANGNFGSTTKRCCPSLPISSADVKYTGVNYTTADSIKLVKLLQYSLYCLRPSRYDPGVFDGSFNKATKNALKKFQEDVALSQTGTVGINEWMALMVSTGNPDRPGTAIDCSTRLTKEKAQALKSAGYNTVGRYLTGDLVMSGRRVAKNLLRSEMQTIFDTGLNLFVIYQDSREGFAQYPDTETYEDLCKVYFTESRGFEDAEKAFSVAKALGVPRGEIIYFAVDYDFVESQVQSKIIPYFRGINTYASNHGNEFRVGIYSARNTCTLVADAGFSTSSFVSDMSTGYSGNKGYPLPDNWAFDQVQERDDFSSSDGSFGIDKNIVSGRYTGFNHFESEKDDEWDLISEPCSAYVLKPKEEDIPIPVYWAKTRDLMSTSAYADYSMYDSVSSGSFIVMKEHNSNRVTFGNDTIQYVYFRDKGGNLNAGYIDTEQLYAHYTVDKFQNCAVYRGGSFGTEGEIYLGCDLDSDYKYEFVLQNPLKSYGKNGAFLSTLPAGTKIRLPKDAVTDGVYANRIQVAEKMLPATSSWTKIDPNNNYGYIDLGFEIGVLPKDRAIITNSATAVPDHRQTQAIYFLPGYLASQLYKSDTDELTWVNMDLNGPLVSDILAHGLPNWEPLVGLDENGNGDKLKVSKYLDSQNGVYGTVLDEKDTAQDIMDNLKRSFGGQYNIEFFAYDWRKDLKLAEQQLRKDISSKGYKNVSFVCHSTGGLLAASYIAESIHRNEQQKINKVVTLGSPLLGTFTSHEALEIGENDALKFDILWMKDVSIGYISDWAKKTIRNTPCSYQLLPSDEFLISGDSGIGSGRDLSVNYKPISTIDGFYSLLNRSETLGQTLNTSMTNGTGPSHKKYREDYLYGMSMYDVFNQVDAFHIAGSFLNQTDNVYTHTGAKYAYTVDNEPDNENLPVIFKEYADSKDGDGTVLSKSALMIYIDRMGNNITPKNYTTYDVDHMNLINGIDSDVFKSVKTFLKTGKVVKYEDTARRTLTTTSLSNDRLGIYIDGKTDIYIYNTSGNLVSSIVNGDSHSNFDKETFSYTFISGEKTNLYIPSNGYKVVFKARENTDLSVMVKLLDEESKTKAAVDFNNISALLQDETVTLNAVSGITQNNLSNLTLLRNNTTVISKTEAKTDYAQTLTVDQNKTIPVGTSTQITYAVTPSNITVNWSSSDTSVATVNGNGWVTATGYGYAVISAATADGNITANCYICVPCNTSSIAFGEDFQLVKGAKKMITPVFTPSYATNTDLSYLSSNPSVASVDNDGLVTAVSSGTAVITASTDNGKSASCTITVTNKAETIVNAISLTPSYKEIDAGDTVTLTADIEPQTALNKNLSWSVSNSSAAIIDKIDRNTCVIKGVGYGETTVNVSSDDGGYSTSASICVKAPSEVKIHFQNSKGWDTPYLYYKNDGASLWQKKPLLSDGNGWYIYTIKDCYETDVVFRADHTADAPDADEAVYTLTGEKWIVNSSITSEKPAGVKVHYYNINNWVDPHIYYYDEQDQQLPWPGVKMSPEGGNSWYTYTIYGVENPRVVLNNNINDPNLRQQHPGIDQPGIEITQSEMWIVNETAYNRKPQGTTVHFYRPADWEPWDTRIYFYEDNNVVMPWPGVPMNNPNEAWMTYTIYGMEKPKVILNDSKNKQIPGKFQEGHLVTREMWLKGDTWTTYEPAYE